MKRLFTFFTTCVALFLMGACTPSLPDRFDALVSSTEEKCATYSNVDWLKATDRFGELYTEFKSTMDDITPNNKKIIEKNIDKFITLIIHSENSVALLGLKQYYDDPGGLFYLRVKDYFKSISNVRLTTENLHAIYNLFEDYDEARESFSSEWREQIESELKQYKGEINAYIDSIARAKAAKEQADKEQADKEQADKEKSDEDKGIVEKVKDFFKKLF